ncbi:tRNA uridine-5-carboxymethylaminomethyl(34) synthesis GTPase MnmE [Sphingomonas koreensis]|nr:tRNA uridine-5-carboxymethylaminomethyl(34) synthesis GTPase MnmE [Sphingomonas koreensis]
MDTIFAVSSGAPPAAIAVLRISGPGAFDAAAALAGTLPPPRKAAVRPLRDDHGALLDRALVLVFAGPRSATGEDLVELHLHGGRAVVAAVESALAQRPGLRRAEAGEFTRRALIAGRIDLAEAEGLGDLLAAETESQRRAAIAAAEGVVSRSVGAWTQSLLVLSARTEALLDFADEDDVVDDRPALSAVKAEAAALQEAIVDALANPPVERLRDGIRVVLAGRPNSGKSTLINALAGRDAAIVSPIAGTTRDRIEVPVTRDGIAYVLTDTAGLAASTDDPIEAIGIARAREAIADADLVLWLDDQPHETGLIVHARADLAEVRQTPADVSVSTMTGAGLSTLWTAIATAAQALLPRLDRLTLNARQRSLCGEAAQALAGVSGTDDPLIVAEHLRQARAALDRVTGIADTEAMLDALFGRFCIGK